MTLTQYSTTAEYTFFSSSCEHSQDYILGHKRQVDDGMGREEGGGFVMRNTCIPVADSF